jgi:hypothetical protein
MSVLASKSAVLASRKRRVLRRRRYTSTTRSRISLEIDSSPE